MRVFGEQRTDVFKAAALRGVKGMFPPSHNPYYASFGTKASDVAAFYCSGVPEGRIFVVSKETGLIIGKNKSFRFTFKQVCEAMEEYFPYVAGILN